MEIHDDYSIDPEKEDLVAIIGTQTGLVKELSLVTGTGSVKYGTPMKGGDIVSMHRGRDESELLIAKKNGLVLLLQDYKALVTVKGFSSPLTGAVLVERRPSQLAIMCVTLDGAVYFVEIPEETSAVNVSQQAPDLQVNRPAEVVTRAPDRPDLFAVGGNENRVRIWNAVTLEKEFEMRNPPDDWLCLKVPVWISGMSFEFGSLQVSKRLAFVTRHRDVQLLDSTAEDRRPVWKTTVGEEPLNCVAFSRDNQVVYCGNSAGFVFVLDALRGKILGRMSPSSAGSIRDLCVQDGYVVAVGLDRFAYAYKQESRKAAHKVYAKQRMNRVLLKPRVAIEQENSDGDDDEDDDDVWMGLSKRMREEDEENQIDEQQDNERDGNDDNDDHDDDDDDEKDVTSSSVPKNDNDIRVQKSLSRLKGRLLKKRK